MVWVGDGRIGRSRTKPRAIDEPDATAATQSLGSGLLGGLLGSLCCLPPAVALALGFGGSTFLVSLGAYTAEFRAAGLVMSGLMAWWALRRQARSCGWRRTPLPFVLLTLGAFVASYLTLIYVAVPFLYEVYARR